MAKIKTAEDLVGSFKGTDASGVNVSFAGGPLKRKRLKSAFEAQAARNREARNKKLVGGAQQQAAGLRQDLANFKPSERLEAETAQQEARKEGPLKEFDAIRRRVEQRGRAQTQEGSDALQRRLAASGALQSGAAIKLQGQQQAEGQRETEGRLEEVGFQEAQERRRQNEQVDQRNFSSREATAGRNFARETANIDNQFRDKVFQFDSKSKLAQLDLQIGQFGIDLETTEFNRKLAEKEAKGRSLASKIFDPGDFLGIE